MREDELDSILSAEDAVEVSSDFTAQVMARVDELTAEAPPLKFPWMRFLIGLAASAVMVIAGGVLLVRSAPTLEPIASAFTPLSELAPRLGYATVATLFSLAIASVPKLLARYQDETFAR